MHFPALRGENDAGWYWFTGSLSAALIAGMAGQVARYLWISTAEQRQQTKWATLGLVALLALPLGSLMLRLLLGIEDKALSHFIQLHFQLAVALLPLTIAVSMMRYRLWDVDPILNRTLVYGSLTAIVLAVYMLLVGGLGQLLRGDSVWLAVMTTGAVALAIHPLRDWLQRAVNRLLYGDHAGRPGAAALPTGNATGSDGRRRCAAANAGANRRRRR